MLVLPVRRFSSGQTACTGCGRMLLAEKILKYPFDQYGVAADEPKDRTDSAYTVQRGDSFWAIARKFNCTMAELERLNNKSRFSLIFPGDVLRAPKK